AAKLASSSIEKRRYASDCATHSSIVRTSEIGIPRSIEWIASSSAAVMVAGAPMVRDCDRPRAERFLLVRNISLRHRVIVQVRQRHPKTLICGGVLTRQFFCNGSQL